MKYTNLSVKGKNELVINMINLITNNEEIKLYVDDEEIMINEIIIKRSHYYNDLFYQKDDF